MSKRERKPLVTKFFGLFILSIVSFMGAIALLMSWLNTGFWGWPYHGSRLRFVENEMHSAVVDLPQHDRSQLLATHDEIFSSHIHVPKKIQSELRAEGEPPCYYGRRFLIFGTQMTEQEVIEFYVQELVSNGWRLVELGGHGRLNRGDSENIIIDQAFEGFYFYDDVGIDYHQAKTKYTELISIQVEYIWPKRAGC
ncbi:MAG: hypothetical protein GY803_13945 [Chloroflexi bacterium]|nr:hypothetical protein [Chloroflexota bacterium]